MAKGGNLLASTTGNSDVRFVIWRAVASDTACATATGVSGDFEFPYTGTITEIGAYNDTAGTTGTMVVDVHLGGTTIMTTDKLDIDTTEKTTRTAATAPTLTTTAITAGDILTCDIDAIHTTPANGLTIRIGVRLD
jgi:hypothetical protein